MVEDGAFSHEIDYVTIVLGILNLEGHPNCKTGSRDTVIFAELVDFAYCWSFSGGESAINGATPSSYGSSCVCSL